MKQYQTDEKKREFITAGISAGVSVAFGAPIGGTLFAYEISSPNTFWTFSILWKNFICSSLSTFAMTICLTLKKGGPLLLSDAGALKFSWLDVDDPVSVTEIPGAIILGLVGGLLGGIFVNCAMLLSKVRKRFIVQRWHKITEVFVFALVSALVFFLVGTMTGRCVPRSDEDFKVYHSSTCGPT